MIPRNQAFEWLVLNVERKLPLANIDPEMLPESGAGLLIYIR
jgi:hypothetical protein